MDQIRSRIASGLGSVLEWYDFSLYGFFAPVLAQIFLWAADFFFLSITKALFLCHAKKLTKKDPELLTMLNE